MKYLLALLLLTSTAYARDDRVHDRRGVNCHHDGDMTYCSNGKSYHRDGDMTYGSDGTKCHHDGDNVYCD